MLDIDDREERKEANKTKKPGTKGIEEGYDPQLLDVAEMVFETWNSVSEQAITRCWVKADILTLEVQASLTAQYGKMHTPWLKFEKTLIHDMTMMIKKMNFKDTAVASRCTSDDLTFLYNQIQS